MYTLGPFMLGNTLRGTLEIHETLRMLLKRRRRRSKNRILGMAMVLTVEAMGLRVVDEKKTGAGLKIARGTRRSTLQGAAALHHTLSTEPCCIERADKSGATWPLAAHRKPTPSSPP